MLDGIGLLTIVGNNIFFGSEKLKWERKNVLGWCANRFLPVSNTLDLCRKILRMPSNLSDLAFSSKFVNIMPVFS